MNWAVPVFLMITGCLLLSKDISYGMLLKKYVKRIVLALFIFGVPFSMMEIFIETKHISAGMLGKAIINVFNGDSWGHLWYLYTLIGIYLVLPLLKPATDNINHSIMRYLLTMMFVLNFCTEIINQINSVHIAFQLPVTYTIFYVLLGKYLSDLYEEDDLPQWAKNKKLCILGVVVTAVLVVIGCIVLYTDADCYFGYASPLIALMAVLIFCLFRGAEVQENWKGGLWELDRMCFGIYLIHPVFINFFYKYLKLSPSSFGGLYPVGVIVFWMLFVFFAVIASWIMGLVKPLRKWIL